MFTCYICNQNGDADEIPPTQPRPDHHNSQAIEAVAIAEDNHAAHDDDDGDDEEESTPTFKYTITKDTCKFFLKTRCKNGISDKNCKYKHLPVCNRLMRNGIKGPFGCQRGKDCEFYHPHMCRESLKFKTCSRDQCKYYHVRGTVKNVPEAPEQQTEESITPERHENAFLGTLQQLQQQVFQIQQQLNTQENRRMQPHQATQPSATTQPATQAATMYPQQLRYHHPPIQPVHYPTLYTQNQFQVRQPNVQPPQY